MALGAITKEDLGLKAAGSAPVFAERLSIVGDDSYTTGGSTGLDALINAALGMQATIIHVLCGDCGDHYATYTPANGGTLKVFLRSTGAEAAGSADLSSTTFNLTILYK